MTPPILASKVHPQIRQRHHADPPGLWISVILGSSVIHGLGFWLFQGVLTGNLLQLQSSPRLIPIDIVSQIPVAQLASLPPKARSQPQSTQPRSSIPTTPPKTLQTPPKPPSPSSPRRQTLATSTSSTPRTSSPNPQTSTSTPKQPTQPNSSQNQSRPKPIDNGNNNNKPSPTPGSSGSSPSPSEPISPTPQQGIGFFANAYPSSLTISGVLKDTPRKLASLKRIQTAFAPDSDVGKLASHLERPLVLEVFLLIDRTGKATVQRVIPASEDTSGINLTQIAQAIIQTWEFEPTYNQQGKPFDQAYQLPLQITPRSP